MHVNKTGKLDYRSLPIKPINNYIHALNYYIIDIQPHYYIDLLVDYKFYIIFYLHVQVFVV